MTNHPRVAVSIVVGVLAAFGLAACGSSSSSSSSGGGTTTAGGVPLKPGENPASGAARCNFASSPTRYAPVA